MQRVVNHLVQLQELTLIRDEQKVAPGGGHLESLNTAVDTMTSQLPPDLQSTVTKLHRKDRLFVVPIADNNCTGCGMKVPISLVQSVRQAKSVMSCPNCARILYYVESAPKRLTQHVPRSAPRKVGIQRFSSASLMLPNFQPANMDECIGILATAMESGGFIDDSSKLIESALRREAVLSTVVDHGLAFPHVRGVEGGGLTLALGTNAEGLKLDSQSDKLTRIVFFMIIPMAASAFYLKLLAGLTETFRKPDACKTLLVETEPEKLWKTLMKLTRATIK